MIFAPVIRRAAYAQAPRSADLALQRFLQISIEGNVVRLHSVEGAPRQVQRAWELAADIDAAHSSAKLENGVLTLTLAKVEPASKATTLTIQ